MISIAPIETVVALGGAWDVVLTVTVIVVGYMIFCPRFLGQYLNKQHRKRFVELPEVGPEALDQQDEVFELCDCNAISEDSLVTQKDQFEVEDDLPEVFETDDFMKLWRSSISGLDESVEAQLDEGFAETVEAHFDEGFADMTGPSCWGLLSKDDSDEQISDDLDDDFWSAPEPVSTDPTADNQALDIAIVSSDALLAGAALRVGARRCGALWACEGLQRLRAAELHISMLHAVELVQLFGGEARADLAADLWLQRHNGPVERFKVAIPEPELYTAVLEVCARCMDFEVAAKVAARAGWCSPSSLSGRKAMLALARWLARRGESSHAWECYQEVRRQGHGPDLATHKAVLAATVRGTDMSHADVIFEDLVASGLDLDDVAFATMIGGYCAVGSLPKAMEYFERMRKYDITPTTSLLDTVIGGCLCCDALALLEQVLADMEADGVPLSSATVEALVRYHGRGGDVERAVAICEELPRRHGFEMDSNAYGALVSVCLAGSRLDLALVTVRRMVAEGFAPSARCYESIVLCCMQHGDVSQAVLFVDDALGCSTEATESQIWQPARSDRPSRHLAPKLLEALLQLIGRKRQAGHLGLPLLTRLQVAGVELPEQLTESLLRAAKLEASCGDGRGGYPVLGHRRVEYQRWRNFSP